MCSQADFVHVDLPIGYVPPERDRQIHSSRRETPGQRAGAAAARSDMTSALAQMDELTLRMVFGDR